MDTEVVNDANEERGNIDNYGAAIWELRRKEKESRERNYNTLPPPPEEMSTESSAIAPAPPAAVCTVSTYLLLAVIQAN